MYGRSFRFKSITAIDGTIEAVHVAGRAAAEVFLGEVGVFGIFAQLPFEGVAAMLVAVALDGALEIAQNAFIVARGHGYSSMIFRAMSAGMR